MGNQPSQQQNPGIVQYTDPWVKRLIAIVFTFRVPPRDKNIGFVQGLPANLSINRPIDASILVSGSNDVVHKSLEVYAWHSQVGVAVAASLKA